MSLDSLSKSVIERVPLGEARILLEQTLLAGLQIRILNAVHPRIGLEHQRFQYPFVFDGFAGQDDLDKILRRDAVETQIASEAFHGAAEFDFGVDPGSGAPRADLVLGPLEHGLEFAHFGHLQVARHDHLNEGLGQRLEIRTLEHLVRPRLDE